jgi:magnesium transporter
VKGDGFELAFDGQGLVKSHALDPDQGFRWTHLDTDELEIIQQAMGQWDLSVPPTWDHHKTHPKHVFLEDYGDFFHVVAYYLQFRESNGDHAPPLLASTAVHLVVHQRGVISWCAHSVPFVGALGRKIRDYPRWIIDRPSLVFAILDELFHAIFPLLDQLNDYIVHLEQHALSTIERKALEGRVMEYKHLVMTIRKILVGSRDMAHNLAHRLSQPSPYYFELYDQVLRLSEIVDGYREMLDTVMDLHLSSASNRMNEIVKTLTLVTTMMLPASLVAALYGMNFEHAPGIHWPYGFYCVLGFVGLVSAGLLVWFKRQAWI